MKWPKSRFLDRPNHSFWVYKDTDYLTCEGLTRKKAAMGPLLLPFFLLFSLFALSVAQGPSLAQVTLTGSGCPPDTFEIALGETGGIVFHSFNLTLGGPQSAAPCDKHTESSSKRCLMRLELEDVPDGARMALREVNVEGKAGLDIGVVASVETWSSWGEDEESEVWVSVPFLY